MHTHTHTHTHTHANTHAHANTHTHANTYPHTRTRKHTHTPTRTDVDVLHEHHQFIRDEEDDAKNTSWGRRLAVKYYRRLFREYAIADLSRFKEGKIGLRWRTEPVSVLHEQ